MRCGSTHWLYLYSVGKLVGAGGGAQAFELLPSPAEVLRRSLLLNNLKQCRVHVVGLGSTGARITLARGLTYMGSLYTPTQSLAGTNSEDCEVVRLDDYCAVHQMPPPHFIKIDIESAEVDALHGARQTLLDTTPTPFVEFHRRMGSICLPNLDTPFNYLLRQY